MTRSLLVVFLGLLAIPFGLQAASEAKVSRSVNIVNHGSTEAVASYPAPEGTLIKNGEYVKTGTKSRAELQLGGDSLTRLGANTIYNYNAAANSGTVKMGSVLFSKPKDNKTYLLKTPGITAAIVGCVVLASYNEATKTSVVLNQAGSIFVTINGTKYPLQPGQGVSFTPGQQPIFFFFDLKKNLETCGLLVDFDPLPPYNQEELRQSLADFGDSTQRGFTTFTTDDGRTVDVGPPTNDNAIHALQQVDNPSAPPPPDNPSNFNNFIPNTANAG